MKAATLTFIGS